MDDSRCRNCSRCGGTIDVEVEIVITSNMTVCLSSPTRVSQDGANILNNNKGGRKVAVGRGSRPPRRQISRVQ
jgi:hypothetical protein